MRWAQLTFVENDVETNDKDFWLKYFTDTHSDAVCLSAGGVVAFYPTKIPFHYRSPWLGDRDLFGELVEGCHERNMIVVARTDSHAVHQDVFEAHPDWIAVDANGQPRRHWSSPELWVACAFGPYSLEFMTEVHRELMTMYDLDGIFTNRWDGSGMCYCEHCQKNFFEAYGMALPTKVDPKDEAWRNYTQFYQDRLFNVWKLWDSEIRKINPEARFIPNGGGGALSLLDMKTVGELSDTLFADRQGRVGLQPPWASGKDAKEFRAALGRKPVVGIFSVGLAMDGDYRWKDSVQSDAELRIWVADGIANGLRPWFTKFASSIYDKRWLKTVKDIYNWHFQSEKYLRNEKPLARVGMVYSQQTALYYGGADAKEKVEDYILGMYQALIEARVPFEMVHDLKLDMENIGQYKVLILPNIAVLSDRQCDQLRQFVRNGGSLIATLETSLYTETGEIRDDFGLADLFGTHYKEQIPGPINNSYLRLETEEGSKTFHPIIEGLGETERITNGLYFLITEPEEQSILAPLTLIPAYPDLPMEMVYPRVEKTDIPAVCLREIGDSRIVYFPWDIDRTFWEVLCVDHSKVIANAIKWAMTNEEQPVTVTGQGLMDLSIWRQKDSMTVHLVNLTNPMTMKGPFREFYPIYDQKVRIRIPEGFRVSDVKYLVSDEAAEYRIENGYVYVTVPTIMDREVLALDLEEMMK
ncbi:beta-galactosidase trimerization domain-containing protein [bacterium]|nr:beta-galactosidase trimerization domain-containing protein [bacterium]